MAANQVLYPSLLFADLPYPISINPLANIPFYRKYLC